VLHNSSLDSSDIHHAAASRVPVEITEGPEAGRQLAIKTINLLRNLKESDDESGRRTPSGRSIKPSIHAQEHVRAKNVARAQRKLSREPSAAPSPLPSRSDPASQAPSPLPSAAASVSQAPTPVPSVPSDGSAREGASSKLHDLHYLQQLYRQREAEVDEAKARLQHLRRLKSDVAQAKGSLYAKRHGVGAVPDEEPFRTPYDGRQYWQRPGASARSSREASPGAEDEELSLAAQLEAQKAREEADPVVNLRRSERRRSHVLWGGDSPCPSARAWSDYGGAASDFSVGTDSRVPSPSADRYGKSSLYGELQRDDHRMRRPSFSRTGSLQ